MEDRLRIALHSHRPKPAGAGSTGMTNFLCLAIAACLTVLLCFVSYVQLLYLESLRLIRRDFPALEFFRETLAEKIGLDLEHGSLAFSLIKHVSLFLVGVFYLCALVR